MSAYEFMANYAPHGNGSTWFIEKYFFFVVCMTIILDEQ